MGYRGYMGFAPFRLDREKVGAKTDGYSIGRCLLGGSIEMVYELQSMESYDMGAAPSFQVLLRANTACRRLKLQNASSHLSRHWD